MDCNVSLFQLSHKELLSCASLLDLIIWPQLLHAPAQKWKINYEKQHREFVQIVPA